VIFLHQQPLAKRDPNFKSAISGVTISQVRSFFKSYLSPSKTKSFPEYDVLAKIFLMKDF